MATVVVPVNAGSEGGGELSGTFWSQKNMGKRKKTTVTFDVADAKIEVDMKKGLTGDIEIPSQPYL